MNFRSKTTYTVEFSSQELLVVLAALNGGTISPEDELILGHVKAMMTHGLATSIQAEHRLFFQPSQPKDSG